MTATAQHNVRIDNRLLHGQVVQYWIPYLKVQHLIVADDMASGNQAMTSVYRMALPKRIGLSVVDVVQLPDAVAQTTGTRLIILADVFDLARAMMAGFDCERVVLGNVHAATGRAQITEAVYLSPEELQQIRAWKAAGMDVHVETFPGMITQIP